MLWRLQVTDVQAPLSQMNVQHKFMSKAPLSSEQQLLILSELFCFVYINNSSDAIKCLLLQEKWLKTSMEKWESKSNIKQGNNICKCHSGTFPLCLTLASSSLLALPVFCWFTATYTHAVPQGEQRCTGEWFYDGHPKTTEANARGVTAPGDAGGF